MKEHLLRKLSKKGGGNGGCFGSFKAVQETLPDLLCDPEPLDRYPCPSQFEDVRAIVCPGGGTDHQPRRHAVHPHAVLRPLHRQGPAQVLDAGPSGSCSTTVGSLVGSVREPIVNVQEGTGVIFIYILVLNGSRLILASVVASILVVVMITNHYKTGCYNFHKW